MDQKIQKKLYLKEFKKRLEKYINHPLNNYQPTNFNFLSQGGQSKVLSFYSNTLKTDLVIKIYPGRFCQEAENEFNHIQLLDHENVIKVQEIGTILEDQDHEEDNNSLDLSQNSDSEQRENYQDQKDDQILIKKEEDQKPKQDYWEQQEADYFIIMEKAEKSLFDEILKRKFKKQPFTQEELFEFWSIIINVFAYCQYCGISHNDIKPSNILLCKDENDNNKLIPKVSDFGTSIKLGEITNLKQGMKDGLKTNLNKFITPLYASPNVCQNVPKINYYLEDVFSLGVTFLQMSGPFSSDQIESFYLNQQETLLDNAFDQQQIQLPYFFQALLRKMLEYESEKRPDFLQLKQIMESPHLTLNLDNQSFIDALIQEKLNQQQVIKKQEKEMSDEMISRNATMFRQDNTLILTKGIGEGNVMPIRNLLNNITRLISGTSKFEPQEFIFTAKAIQQSQDLIILENTLNSQPKLYKPIENDFCNYHKNRPFLFASECQTIVNTEGQLFVLGGRYQLNYLKTNLEIIINLNKNKKDLQIIDKNPPISYRFKKNLGFFGIKNLKDMIEEKSNMGHCSTKKEIFIAGGTNNQNYAIKNVESYDIKKDAWKLLPQMNFARCLSGLCFFRQRYLYVFGGLDNNNDFVEQIEKFDVREGIKWEILKINLLAHSIATLQVSASQIIILGSYFQETYPLHNQLMIKAFDHDKTDIQDLNVQREEGDVQQIQIGSFLDTVTTNQRTIFRINSSTSSLENTLYHCIKIDDLNLLNNTLNL